MHNVLNLDDSVLMIINYGNTKNDSIYVYTVKCLSTYKEDLITFLSRKFLSMIMSSEEMAKVKIPPNNRPMETSNENFGALTINI
jgi:hypothetical protein